MILMISPIPRRKAEAVKSLDDLPEVSQVQKEEFREQAEQEVSLQLNI